MVLKWEHRGQGVFHTTTPAELFVHAFLNYFVTAPAFMP